MWGPCLQVSFLHVSKAASRSVRAVYLCVVTFTSRLFAEVPSRLPLRFHWVYLSHTPSPKPVVVKGMRFSFTGISPLTENWATSLSCGYLNKWWLLFAENIVSICTNSVCCIFLTVDLIFLQCCLFYLLIQRRSWYCYRTFNFRGIVPYLTLLCFVSASWSLLVILVFFSPLMLLSFHLILFFCRFLFGKAMSYIPLRMPNSVF